MSGSWISSAWYRDIFCLNYVSLVSDSSKNKQADKYHASFFHLESSQVYLYLYIKVSYFWLLDRHGILRKRASIAHGSFGQIVEGFVEALKIKLWKLSKGFPQNDALFQQNYAF